LIFQKLSKYQQGVMFFFQKCTFFDFFSAKAAAAIASGSSPNMGAPSPGIGGQQDFGSFPGGSGQGGYQNF
jgi:hypothetical protein